MPVAAGEDVCFFEDGKLSAFNLSSTIEIFGVPCMAGTRLWFHRNGGLRGCTLADESVIQGLAFDKGSFVLFDEEGIPIPFEINSPAGPEPDLIYYDSGELWGKLLAREEEFHTVLCSRGTWVWYYRNGRVSSLEPAVDTKRGNAFWRHGTRVYFHENGEVMRCNLPGDMEIQGIPVSAQSFLLFHDNGVLAACRLARDHVHSRIHCKGGRWIGFYENGGLKRCFLGSDTYLNGLLLKEGSWAAFHKNGTLENYKLTEACTVQGAACGTGDILLFDEDGQLVENVPGRP